MNIISKQLLDIASQIQNPKTAGLLDSIKDFFKNQKNGAGSQDIDVDDAISELSKIAYDRNNSIQLLIKILSGDSKATDFLKPMEKYKSLKPIVLSFKQWIAKIYDSFKQTNPQASTYLKQNKGENLDKFKKEKIIQDMNNKFLEKLKEACQQIRSQRNDEMNNENPMNYGQLKSFEL